MDGGTDRQPHFPEPTVAELQELLTGLRVSTDKLKSKDLPALQKLLRRALDKAQHLSESVKEMGGLVPSDLPKGSRNEELFTAFSRNRSIQEIMSLQSGQGADNHYLQYRETLILIAHHHRTSSCVNITLQDKQDTAGIVMRIQGLRQFDAETPLFEVQYMYNTKGGLQGSQLLQESLVKTLATSSKGNAAFTVRLPELALMRQVLEMNAEKLDPKYKQKCRRKWGMRKGFAVSFLVPAGLLAEDEAEKIEQSKCALPDCGLPASQQCSRCRVAYYCGIACQRKDWKRHKAECNTDAAVSPASTASNAGSNSTAAREGGSESGGSVLVVHLGENPLGPGQPTYASTWSQTASLKDTMAKLKRQQDNIEETRHDESKIAANIHGNKRFMVKVQLARFELGEGPHLLYDQKRSFEAYITPAQDSYKPLMAKVRLHGFVGGIKGYFGCERASDHTLRVFLDDVPTTMPLW